MEALLTMSYLVIFFGIMGGITYALNGLYEMHKRGMERVRAYDNRQESKK